MSSIWAKYAFIANEWAKDVRITHIEGVISHLETNCEANRTDECHKIIIPGLANVHSHAFQRGMAGLAEQKGGEGDNFWSWREIMYHFLDRLSPDDVEAISAMAFMEMLESGFTRVGEFHYLHNDISGNPYDEKSEMAQRVISAAEECGIWLCLLPVFYAHSNFGGQEPNHGQRRFINKLDSFAEVYESSKSLIKSHNNIGIAPHSLRAVSQDELTNLLKIAPKGPVHIHASEQEKEVNDCLEFYKKRPIEWLLDNYPIDENWCFIHATHINMAETLRLAKTGAVAGLCPITEANLGDGIFPARDFLGLGGRIGIGTDSNILIDAPREICALEYSQRLLHRSRNVLANCENISTGRNLFEKALNGGAQALGFNAEIAIGAAFTFVALNGLEDDFCTNNPNQYFDKWIFGTRINCVDAVWVNGKKLVSNGHHIKKQAIESRYKKTLASIMSL